MGTIYTFPKKETDNERYNGSCWLNQLPGLTHMPLIRELLTDLDIPENHIVYGSVVMGYAAEESRLAAPRKNAIHIIR